MRLSNLHSVKIKNGHLLTVLFYFLIMPLTSGEVAPKVAERVVGAIHESPEIRRDRRPRRSVKKQGIVFVLSLPRLYSLWLDSPLRVLGAMHPAPLTVSRHGAICASVLVSKLPDTLSLDYTTYGS